MEQTATNRGQEIADWIAARHAEGKTVYAQTHLRTVKLTPRHAICIRVKGTHCEVQFGKRWDSINYCKLTAV